MLTNPTFESNKSQIEIIKFIACVSLIVTLFAPNFTSAAIATVDLSKIPSLPTTANSSKGRNCVGPKGYKLHIPRCKNTWLKLRKLKLIKADGSSPTQLAGLVTKLQGEQKSENS